jgi:hypothetical protein
MVVTSVAGHLQGVKFPDQYSNWSGSDPVVLFEAPVEKYVPEVRLRFREGCKVIFI